MENRNSSSYFACFFAFCFFMAVSNITSAETFDAGQGIPACPALNQGERFMLNPPLTKIDFISDNVDYNEQDLQRARNIVAYLECAPCYKENGAPAYDAVSDLDGISIGQMQWHWSGGDGTLITEFIASANPSGEAGTFIYADNDLRSDLYRLFQYSFIKASHDLEQKLENPSPETAELYRKEKESATKIYNKWKEYLKDPNGDGLKSLKSWLRSDKGRNLQDGLIRRRMIAASRVAETWMRDRNYRPLFSSTTRILFFNLNIHSGVGPSTDTLRDVWSEQVDEFKSNFSTNKQLFKYVIDWINSCQNVEGMKGKPDAFGASYNPKGNVEIWGEDSFIESLAPEQVDMFAYSFLYATRSKTDGKGTTFPGYQQLELLNRAAVIALTNGIIRGERFDPANFDSR